MTVHRCRSGPSNGPDRTKKVQQIRFVTMNSVRFLGIKFAYNRLLVVPRRLYAPCCSALRTHWQVSGHSYSGATQALLLSPPRPYRPLSPFFPSSSSFLLFSRSKRNTRRLRRAVEWTGRTSPASEWPIYATNADGRSKLWRPSCKSEAWTSAACPWPVSSMGFSRSTIPFLPRFCVSSAFPLSSFSRRRFRIWTPNTQNFSLNNCPIRVLPGNAAANAES